MTALLEPIQLAINNDQLQEHIVLYDISWDFYEALLVQLNERRLFVTYDEGVMEIMAPSFEHDRGSRELELLITLLAEELDLPMICIGSTTIRRKELRKGIEADEGFYFQNVDKIRGLRELDFSHLPPPDLAVEVEISSRLGIRKGIYAALGVPEIWRFDGKRLVVELLQQDRSYSQSESSPTFPTLPLDQVAKLIDQAFKTDRTSWIKSTRQWIRENVIPH